MFDRYYAPLCRFAAYWLRDRTSAEEIVLDTFTHIWQHAGELRISTSVRAYLFRAVRNRAQSAAAVPSTPLPELLLAAAADLAPARARIEAILRLLEAGKDAAALSAVAQLQAEYPQLLGGDALASALEQSLGVATTAGAKSAGKDLSKK